MKLYETLRFCLLSLASRYPHSCLTLNEAVLGPQSAQIQGWTSLTLLACFQETRPEVLEEPACLRLDAQTSIIALLDRSPETPALWVQRPANKHPFFEEEILTPAT